MKFSNQQIRQLGKIAEAFDADFVIEDRVTNQVSLVSDKRTVAELEWLEDMNYWKMDFYLKGENENVY